MNAEITITDIEKLNYVQFISLLRETNRCPGGKHTIRKILQNSFLDRNSLVLDIGCNTGFTTLEIARTAKCQVIGIDPIQEAIDTAMLQLSSDTDEIRKIVSFQKGSALELDFPDNTFDLVVTGGATSFIDEKQKAINEYYRVMKPWGFLSVTNLCYVTDPPEKLINDISSLIGVKINPWSALDWLNLFSKQEKFEIYNLEEYKLYDREESVIENYVDIFMEKDHLSLYNEDVKATIRSRWLDTINLFNENHKYLGFISVLFRKAHIKEEPELFSRFDKIL